MDFNNRGKTITPPRLLSYTLAREITPEETEKVRGGLQYETSIGDTGSDTVYIATINGIPKRLWVSE